MVKTSLCVSWVFFFSHLVVPSIPSPPPTHTHSNTIHFLFFIYTAWSLSHTVSDTRIPKNILNRLCLCAFVFETDCPNPQDLSFSQRGEIERDKEQLRWERIPSHLPLCTAPPRTTLCLIWRTLRGLGSRWEILWKTTSSESLPCLWLMYPFHCIRFIRLSYSLFICAKR